MIGCESLGVRGLSCFIVVGNRSVLIDPGVSLGYVRYGLHPHPLQAAFSELTKALITSCWLRATDVIVTHLHGDHVPLYNANPFQFPLSLIGGLNNHAVLWVGSLSGVAAFERVRFERLRECFRGEVVRVNGCISSSDGFIEFSGPYRHGLSRKARVMAVKVGSESDSVAHLSDTQLLTDEVITKVRSWRPKVVITDGPPLYRLYGVLKEKVASKALINASKLADYADYVIIDHHVCRDLDGAKWVDTLRSYIGNRVMSAADFMGMPRLLLEAWRKVLYEELPTRNDWFITSNYRGLGEALRTYGELIVRLIKELPKETTLTEEEVRKYLRR